MADIELKFIHPTDGRVVRARVDDTMTSAEVVQELVGGGFLAPHTPGYELVVKGGDQLPANQTLAAAGVKDDTVIRILPISEAGGLPVDDEYLAIPGVRRSKGDRLTINDIQRSPAAVIMLAHMYDDLQRRYEKQACILEIERLKSNSRFTAALLLLISQLILAIGGNLLTQNQPIALVVLIAGGLQALLALYLSFRSPKEIRGGGGENTKSRGLDAEPLARAGG